MSAPYYQDDSVTLWHGDAEEILPSLETVDHFIADPPYSEHVHGSARTRRMQSANDRGGRYGADLRRNVDLGFTHLTPELRDFLAAQAARLTKRWVLVFSDTEGAHLWADALTEHGLDYVRTGAWVKRGSTPQFSGDRPATGHESITICHPLGRKRWNGGGVSRRLGRADRSEPLTRAQIGASASDAEAAGSYGATRRPVHRPGRAHLRPHSGLGHDRRRCEATGEARCAD